MPKKEVTLNSRAMEALNKYIEHLNKWEEHEFKLDEFFEYGETKLLKEIEIPGSYWPERLIVMTAGFGDEGGPSLLVAKFRLPNGPGSGRLKNGSWELQWLMQEFDTMGEMIWSDHGGWVNVPTT